MARVLESPREARRIAGFRPDIEGLRGLSVALVVAYHATTLSNSPFQLNGGFIGVDVFFVLSGFLLTGLLLREHEREGRISFSAFYARRIRRILPAAMVTLLVTIVLSYVLVNAVDRSSVMLDGTSAAVSIANFRFLADTKLLHPVQRTTDGALLPVSSVLVVERRGAVLPGLASPGRACAVAATIWRRSVDGDCLGRQLHSQHAIFKHGPFI
jgi:hypothetical protein